MSTLGYAYPFIDQAMALGGYNVLALRHLGRSLPYPRVALTSFIANAVGHKLDMALLHPFVPLPLLEVSRLTGSFAGCSLGQGIKV